MFPQCATVSRTVAQSLSALVFQFISAVCFDSKPCYASLPIAEQLKSMQTGVIFDANKSGSVLKICVSCIPTLSGISNSIKCLDLK